MRLFTAIDISEEVRARLRRTLGQLRTAANLRWTAVENLHITTKFIGEWSEDRLGEVKDALQTVPRPGAMEIVIRGLGWFPNPHNPRVLFANVSGELSELARNTSRVLEPLGIAPEDREYKPHLTLARTREGMPKEALAAVRRAIAALDSTDFGAFRALSQCLYLSAGGRYSKLAEFPLVNGLVNK